MSAAFLASVSAAMAASAGRRFSAGLGVAVVMLGACDATPAAETVALTVELDGRPYTVTRPVGCTAPAGAPTDLASEPAEWLAFAQPMRWTDRGGCPVRIDVISHIRGSDHCGWQAAEFLTIGTPIGASIKDVMGNRYIWDPGGVIPGAPRSSTLNVSDLPDSAYDTGYRQLGTELWLDNTDADVAYRIVDDLVEVWYRDADAGLCT